MLKAGDELGDALNGDYSEKEKAEKFGKAAVMLLLAAGAMYGSMAMVMQPKMLRSIVTESKSAIGQTFANMKSLVQISYIQDVDSMLLYCEEFVSGPALQTLKEAVKGCNVKQLHEMAKMIREAKNTVGRILKEDELFTALESWKVSGKIKEAIQAVVDWIQLNGLAANRNNLKYKEVNIHGKIDSELDSVDLVNQIIFEDKHAKNLYMDHPDCPQTEEQWVKKQIFKKGIKRIEALRQEKFTMSIKGSDDLPDVEQLKSIRKFVFVLDADTPALRQAMEIYLSCLGLKYPDYEFWAIYGGK